MSYRLVRRDGVFGADASSFKLTEKTTCGYTIAQIQQIFTNEGYYKGPIDGNTGTLDFMNAFFAFVKASGVPLASADVPPEFCVAMDAAAVRAGVQKTPPPPITIDDPVAIVKPSTPKWLWPVVIGGGALVIAGLSIVSSGRKYQKNQKLQTKWPPMTKSEERNEYIKFAMRSPNSFTREEAEKAWKEFNKGIDRSEETVYGKSRKK